MELLSNIFYFVFTLGILIFVHELGHFAAAKIFGMRVDRFSIGFPPRAFGKKVGDTDYCISWIPIGGYVKISGMIDESFDNEHLRQEPQPWEYRSKPIWQRMVVISAGVIMNILLAILIVWGINYVDGKSVYSVTEVGSVAQGSAAERAGLLRNDNITSINGHLVRTWDDVENIIYGESMGDDLSIQINRNDSTMTLSVLRTDIPSITEERFGILPKGVFPKISRVDGGKPAEGTGILPGDIILSVNGVAVDYYTLATTINQYKSVEIEIEWKRNDELMLSKVVTTEDGRIGVELIPHFSGSVIEKKFSLGGALFEGARDLWNMTTLLLKNIYAIFAGKVSLSESVGGPVKIAQLATRSAEVGLTTFLGLMAMLSLTLAILNFLPFPALDGGHLLFLIIEGLFRREIPNKIKLALQQAGFFLLLVFMAFVLYNDIVRF